MRARKLKESLTAELSRINVERDGLRPSDLYDLAERGAAPELASELEWDNNKCGREYRLIQIRQIVRLAAPIIELPDGSKRRDPFIHIPATDAERKDQQSGEGVYRPASVVVQNVDWYARALGALNSKMRAAIQAAEELQDAAQSLGDTDRERMAKITVAMAALNTANAAVTALH